MSMADVGPSDDEAVVMFDGTAILTPRYMSYSSWFEICLGNKYQIFQDNLAFLWISGMARPFLSMVGLGLWSLNWTILSTFKHPTLTTTCWRPHLNIVMLTVGSHRSGHVNGWDDWALGPDHAMLRDSLPILEIFKKYVDMHVCTQIGIPFKANMWTCCCL